MDRIIEQEKKQKKIIIGYVIAFILLLLSYFITLYANNQLLRQMKNVTRSYQVINNVEQILTKVKDAEAGVRGYIINKNTAFLNAYYSSKTETDSLFSFLTSNKNGSSVQENNLKKLQSFINNRYQMLGTSLQMFNDNKQQINDNIQGMHPLQLELMNNINTLVNLIKKNENTRLVERDKQLSETLDKFNLITYISLTLGIGLIVFGVITYISESMARKKAMYRIKDFQVKLQQQIEELNKANNQLIEMRNQEKFASTGRIARTIAHEVRNPLTNINLANEQLKSEFLPEDENAATLFEMINRNSNRINNLISDLLNSTKFVELNHKSISINDLMDETLVEAEDRIQLNNIKVEKKYSDDICDVSADKFKLKIALLNIVINAVEAMEDAPEKILKIITKGEDDKCVIEISDTGTGMNEEAISRLFEPYFTSKQKGNGLGLTNTQNIILNHKGNIKVKSKEGEGTVFIITLDFAS